MNIKTGHVAVITGAGGGLGGALAHALAAKGCALALVDISAEALAKTASSLPSCAGKVTQHVVDVTDCTAMEALRDEVLTAHGGVNILINNAGITLQKNFSTHSLEDWERMVGINLWGVIYGCHFFDEALTQANDAHLVNLSSMSAFLGLPGQSSYCATKAGVQLLTDSLMAEWSLKNIGVTSVHPGAIRTNMIMATLEESDDIEQAKKNFDLAHKTGAEWSLKNIGVTSVHPGAIRTNMIMATLEESDDIEQAKKNFDLAHKTGVDADYAAAKIIRAIEKNKPRLKIGKDAHIFHFIMRYVPGLGGMLTRKIAQKLSS